MSHSSLHCHVGGRHEQKDLLVECGEEDFFELTGSADEMPVCVFGDLTIASGGVGSIIDSDRA